MSAYTEFVRQHIGKVAGKTQKDKFRAVAALWRRQKGHGKGLSPPGVPISHGRGMKKRCAGTNSWSDYGGKPQLDGEGVGGSVVHALQHINTPKKLAKAVFKHYAPKLVDATFNKGIPHIISQIGLHHPKVASLLKTAFDYGGKSLANMIHKKIEGFGMRHAHMYLKHHMATHKPKRGGALSGPISARQQAALAKHIRGQM